MKKFFALFLGLMVPAILLAQNVQMMQHQNPYYLDAKYLQAPANPIPFADPKALPSDRVQAAKTVDTVLDAYFSYYGTVSPIAYEPISKTLVHVQNLRENISGVQRGTVYAKYSTNNGTTWSQKRSLWSEDNKFALFPSVALVNLDATNNPANLVYFVYSPYYDMTLSNYNGAMFNYNYKQVRSTSFEWGPKANQYRWWENKLVAINGNGEGFVYGVGQLDPEPNNQYGLFGFTGYFVDNQEPQATTNVGMPPQWGKDRFRDPNNLNSTYLVSPNIDVDPEGNIYVSNNTYFPSDENSRVVGVSKSVNNGQSWSEFDPMPMTVITEWATNEGSITDNINFWGPVWVVFSQDAFVVTGVDEYSYFYRLWTSTDGQQYTGYHIVEAFRKNDGVWGMRKVADYNPNPIYLSLDQDNTEAIKDTIIENRFLNEIQAAKTADGKHIVLKWIEPTEKEITFDPPFSYVGEGSQGQDTTYTFSAMNTTDIFVAYRETASDDWSNAKNVTDDDLYNKCTQMPIIVPDINNIPIVEMESVDITNTTHPWFGHYSKFMQQLKIDPWYTQYLKFTNYNATGSVDVETVEAPSTFRLNDVYPNPVVNGHAEISFSIDRNADTRLELFNSLGQFVKLLQAGELPSGPFAVNVNTNDLPSGVYYYTLTVGGETLTKTMTVIK